MKTRIMLVVASLLAVHCASTASADLINIDIDGKGGAPNPVTYSGAAAVGATGDVWNSYFVDTSVTRPIDPATSGVLKFADNTTSTATFDLTSVAADAMNYSSNALVNDTAYVQTTWASDTIPTSATWTVQGLTAGASYDVYVYCAVNNSEYGATHTIGSDSQTNTSVVYGGGALTLGQDYLKFASVTATDGTISGSWTASHGKVYGMLEGLQIQSVPEPGTLILLATGLIGLLAYAWRKRR